jgi:hypothetical protein
MLPYLRCQSVNFVGMEAFANSAIPPHTREVDSTSISSVILLAFSGGNVYLFLTLNPPCTAAYHRIMSPDYFQLVPQLVCETVTLSILYCSLTDRQELAPACAAGLTVRHCLTPPRMQSDGETLLYSILYCSLTERQDLTPACTAITNAS